MDEDDEEDDEDDEEEEEEDDDDDDDDDEEEEESNRRRHVTPHLDRVVHRQQRERKQLVALRLQQARLELGLEAPANVGEAA